MRHGTPHGVFRQRRGQWNLFVPVSHRSCPGALVSARHPHCCTGFAVGDRVCHPDEHSAGVVVDDDYHTFDDRQFTPRVLVEWEDGTFSDDCPTDRLVKIDVDRL